jgi:hypothetical protein
MDNWYKYMFYDIIININNIIIEKNNEINISILIKRYSLWLDKGIFYLYILDNLFISLILLKPLNIF